MVFVESSSQTTSADFLGKLLAMSLKLWYFKRADDAQLHPSVRQIKERMRDDLGTRLHGSANSVLLAALALHPTYKNIDAPAKGIPQSAYLENESKNILTFFFRDLKKRMTDALMETIQRLKLEMTAPPAPLDPNDAIEMYFVNGYRAAAADAIRPDQEIRNWLEAPCVILKPGETFSSFWEKMNGRPLLKRVAKAIGTVQASNAASERTFSLANYLAGGDRASVLIETLNARILLKHNTKVRAKAEGISLMDALTKPKKKE